MTVKIEQKITGYRVKTEDVSAPQPEIASKEVMHEGVARPEQLIGRTYKIKPPHLENALYVTINDMVLNGGTEHEELHPYEIFINTKDMSNFEWVVALTRVISAVFRKGGSIDFLIDELKSVFSPSGGYRKKGGKYMNSLVAEIGEVIEKHLQLTGQLKVEGLSEVQKEFIEKKKAEAGEEGLKNASICPKCGEKTFVLMDNCYTCVSCSHSKCG